MTLQAVANCAANMRVYQVVVFSVVAGTLLPVALHHHVHGGFDLGHFVLAFFLWLNTIIAFWEICLFLRIGHIERQHARFIVDYKGRELDRVKDYFGMKIPLSRIASPTLWAEIWSSYSVFDESYANRKSYGFFIDVGNGFTTLLPSVFSLYALTYELIPARALGLLLVVLNYQMWYGTVVYFASFVFNKRYVGHTRMNLALFVGLSNGLWFTLPLWGVYAGIQMVYSNSYAIFRP